VTPNRPYLIRAIYEWLVDNGMTPHLLVDARANGVEVPPAYVSDGQIVLNIAPGAVRDLRLGNDMISFNARFGGLPTDIFVPPGAVLGIYARENGHGMLFSEDADGDGGEPRPPSGGGRPSLKVIK